MRLAAYTATSVGLASCVILNALNQRTNFYSASVYLAQSSACLMILTNGALLIVSICMLGLQKLLYGPLRPIEVEQLYEKAWFAITETCLAMTIFREEVGGWFLVMFVSLLIGKVWGWIGEGRVEILEQQPPSNPTLFHARLSFSLLISTIFDVLMLVYSVKTVLHHARPNMMVMFAFEFAVLCVTSSSTIGRYLISLREAFVIQAQTNERRAQILRSREPRAETSQINSSSNDQDGTRSRSEATPNLSNDLADIDVPGWEAKGRWIFYLDLATDFFKLILYLTFFCVLCMFYGMPIHIIRDVALTIRSFHKRLLDFIRYRQATHDMNTRYPDASFEEVRREDCCIICREDMTPWPQRVLPSSEDNLAEPPLRLDERFRPKKLPCGHVLHFACLKSWLERQQTCPTCRTPVLDSRNPPRPSTQVLPQPTERSENGTNAGHGGSQGQRDPPQEPRRPNVFQLGPLRIVLGGRHATPARPSQVRQAGPAPDAVHATNQHNPQSAHIATMHMPLRPDPRLHPALTSMQLHQIEQNLLRELSSLHLQADQLFHVRTLQNELARLRSIADQIDPVASLSSLTAQNSLQGSVHNHPLDSITVPNFSAGPTSITLASGDDRLPGGVTIPEGWTLLPLQPVQRDAPLSSVQAGPRASYPSPPTPVSEGVNSSEQARSSSQSSEVQHPYTSSSLRDNTASLAGEGLPQWGSAAAQADSPKHSPESRNAQSQKLPTESDKGKGKAATVEDGQEDVD